MSRVMSAACGKAALLLHSNKVCGYVHVLMGPCTVLGCHQQRAWHHMFPRKVPLYEHCLVCRHTDFVTALDFHPADDKYFLSGSIDGKVSLHSSPSAYMLLLKSYA